MNTQDNKQAEQVWDLIDREKARDRMIRRVSRTSWVIALIVLLGFLAFTIMDLTLMLKRYNAHLVTSSEVWKTLVPFAIILGSVSVLIGVISTIGVFLRLRTTSLLEVQQRLSNLEQLITSDK